MSMWAVLSYFPFADAIVQTGSASFCASFGRCDGREVSGLLLCSFDGNGDAPVVASGYARVHVGLSFRPLETVSTRVKTNRGVCEATISSFLLQSLPPEVQISDFVVLLSMKKIFLLCMVNKRSEIE